MAKYFAKRLLQVVPVLLGVSLVVFLMIVFLPGDPALLMLGPEATPEDLAALRSDLGLDQPTHIQHFKWLRM